MANQTQKEMYKQMAKLQKAIKNDVCHIYACFIKCLYEEGWTVDQIEDLVVKTQQAWQENTGRMDDMVQWCEEVTGIEVRTL